MKKQKDR